MEDLALVATVSVPKAKATYRSGAKKGKLRKGCRWAGRGARCTPEVAKRLGKMKMKGGSKRKGKKGKGTHPCASANPPPWCNKKKGGGGGGGRAASGPHSVLFSNLAQARKGFKKASTCAEKRFYAKAINLLLGSAAKIPAKSGEEGSKRNRRYASEGERVLREGIRFCSGAQERAKAAAAAAAFRGIRGMRGRR